jgi:hypothetical protein
MAPAIQAAPGVAPGRSGAGFPPAQPGDELDAPSMTACAGQLLEQAAEVTRRIALAQTQQDVDALARQHERLVAAALNLNDKAVSLVAGEAKLEGSQIAGAIEHTNQQLSKITETRKALAVLDALLSFTAAVLTGSGKAILKAAAGLKKALDG